MPPKSLGRTLSTEEIDILKRWIEQGAEWQPHWAFLPPVAAPAPTVKNPTWPATRSTRSSWPASRPRDCAGPRGRQGAADPPRHLRPDRAAADPRRDRRLPGRSSRRLRAAGRPPAGVAAFRRAHGRHWLDLARYADTYGYQPDVFAPRGPSATGSSRPSTTICPTTGSSPSNWPATCCPSRPATQVLATAFNRHHRQTNEGGSIEEEYRVEYVADRINTFATAFLGLTLECARCHSHKYDPITQKEYYQLFGFFNSIDESGLYSHFTDAMPTPTLILTTPDQDRAIAATEAKIRAAEAGLDRLAPDDGRRSRPG